ncbi:hypothetical protein B0H10DRAFT_2224391 [Mycena sp. CBHHK59/15]|nr:hypothetical protein B0H10DRAFT_2224391 [Mycena sp. CBHHK59/15]
MAQSRPEPMNASPHHSKVKVSMTLGSSVFVAGGYISGKMEMECRADKGLGIGVMMVELFAIQELTSRDHSATSTFLHSRRLFQGPGLPPSNAVQPHPVPGEPPLPSHYHQARRGQSTFLFRFPIPSSSPSSINFGGDLARVRYELHASVGVCWKGEKRLVTDKKDLEVVECFEEDFSRPEPEGVVVAENGKIWAQGKIVGGVVVAGESACVELQVKNHSAKKNSGLVVTFTRTLVLSGVPPEKSPLQISDTLVTVPFRGQEYIIPPGAEGVASLVFDVPRHARGVKGGMLEGDESAPQPTQAIFEVRCVVGIKMTMGFGSKDIELDLPVTVVHPLALPELLPPPQQYEYTPTPPVGYQPPYADPRFAYPALPMSPPIPTAYIDPQQTQVWLPPPSHAPHPYQYYSPPVPGQAPQQYYFPPPPTVPVYQPLPLNLARPLSAGSNSRNLVVPGQQPTDYPASGEEGKGERASRISQHLRQSTRNRSASPLSHRYPVAVAVPTPSNPIPIPQPQTLYNTAPVSTTNLSVSPAAGSAGDVISPRPVLSPKQSFTHSLPKSERVEELERMAAAVALQTSNLSGDIPKSALLAEPQPSKKERRKSKSPSKRSGKCEKEKEAPAALVPPANMNKTLPGPPVPTGKAASTAPTRTRVDTYFELPRTSAAEQQSATTPKAAAPSLDVANLTSAEKAPPTPTLTATKRPAPGLVTSESGLDALERRLLLEVGTRKMDVERRPDVRSVMAQPMDIPPKKGGGGDVNDSAISSLTLAGDMLREHEHEQDERDRDSDERTQGAKKSSSGRTERGGDGERKGGRKKEKTKEADPRKMRKAAKGRIAAWLGGIDPDAPPEAAPSTPSPDIDVDQAAAPPVEAESGDASASPNPRSSGFVPVKTFKRDPFQRIPDKGSAFSSPTDEAKRIAHLWSSPVLKDKSPILPKVISPTRTPQSVYTDRKVSPPSSPFKAGGATAAVNGWNAVNSPAAAPKKVVVVVPSPRLPIFPPPRIDPEVKYDIRSARGGRGGKVTAVASIWASGALADQSKDKDALPAKAATAADFLRSKPAAARPSPKSPLASKSPKDVTSTATAEVPDKRPRPPPVIKSASLPAMISSSHATPTLSSTASLARPAAPPNKPRAPPRVPPTIAETASEVVLGLKGRVQASMSSAAKAVPVPSSSAAAPAPAKPGDLAFGQARLRDLIKKYQGQTAA